MSGQSITPLRVTTKEVSLRGHNIPHNLRGNSKALSVHQLQGAEAPGASEEESIQDTSGQSTIPLKVMIKEVSLRGHNIPHNLRDNSKAPLGHQPQGVEVAETSEEDTEISLEDYTAYSAVKTRATPQESAKSQFKSRRK